MVETSELLQTVVVSVVAGVGVTIAFSIAIWGAARFVDLSRSERSVAAAAAAAAGILSLGVTLAAVVFGVIAIV
jgi:predicted permease